MKTLINSIGLILILLAMAHSSYCENLDTKHLLAKADSLLNASNHEKAIAQYKILVKYHTDNEQWDEVVKTYFKIAYAYQLRGVFDSSFSVLNISYEFILKYDLENENLWGTYYYLKGSSYNKTGNLDSALMLLDLSLIRFKDGINDSLQVLVKRSIGNIHYTVGDYNLALKFYNDALIKERLRIKPSEIMLAALYQNIGIVYSTTGSYDSARVYLNRSITLKEKTLNKMDPQLAIGYLNYGRFLYIIGYPDQALQYYSKAEEIYYKNFGNNYFGLAPIYYNKGSIYILLRDLDKALTYHERAVELYLKTMNHTNPIFGDLYMNLGVIYENKGDLTKAIHFYNEVLIGNYNPESLVKALKSLGRCYFNLNNIIEAEKNLKFSITKAEKLFGKNHHITAGSYYTYGDFCLSLKNYIEAEEFLNKALKIRLTCFGSKNSEVSFSFISIGDLYNKMGDKEKALTYYQNAIISSCDNFNSENIYHNPPISDIEPEFNKFITLYKKAYTLYDIYNEKSRNSHYLILALETSKLSITLFELILASYKDDNTKIITNEYVYDIYNLVVLVAIELYSQNNDPKYLNLAFEYSEKGKAAILLSSIKEFEAIEIGNIPINIKKMEESLKRELSLLKNFMNDESQKSQPDSSKLDIWKKVIFTKTFSYDSLIGSIEIEYPDYYKLKYQIEVADVKEIQGRLNSNEIFIEYKLVDSLLLIFSISKEDIKLNKRILENDFNEKVVKFISSINQFPLESFDKENYLEFIYTGNDLYRTLLDPFVNPEKYTKIIIIPDNILGYLPFEALIEEYIVPDKIDFRNLSYVVKSFIVSYSYSGTLLFKYVTKNKGNAKLLAMAPSYGRIFENSTESFAGSRDILKHLSSLNYSIEEVNNIASLINGKILTGDDATESNFKKEAERFGILHFAMHTLIDDDNPMTSKLVFTLNNDSTEDGFLNAYEIYNLKLNAVLAVLSACKTGIGKYSKGEGIMSLARGFFFAGVPSIVMTLWEVEDISGSEIMYDFYENLKTGMQTDEALRMAKLNYLNASDPLQSHPYFWAAYVQIGKTDPIINFTFRKKLVISVSAILVVVFLFFLKKRMIKKKEINF